MHKILSDWEKQLSVSRTKSLHASLYRKMNIKKSIADFPHPTPSGPMIISDPMNPQCISHDLLSASNFFSSTLSTLGGDPDFTPPDAVFQQVIASALTCPSNTAHHDIPELSSKRFQELVRNSKPTKAGGTDNTNFYLISLALNNIQSWILNTFNHFCHLPIPEHWSKSNVFLLFKLGDPLDTKNYRPISLLHSVFKVVSTHLFDQLYSHVEQHNLMHKAQHGGLPGFRTSDHLLHLKTQQHLFPNSYHLYIDLNKAFNSIPINSLMSLPSHYNLPTLVVSSINFLYTHTIEQPLINGLTYSHQIQRRGLRQGCPLSPLLFNLPQHHTTPY